MADPSPDSVGSPSTGEVASGKASKAAEKPTAVLARDFWMDNNTKKWTKRYRTEVAASIASLSSTLVAYPLDSVKTRMQAYRYRNFLDCVQHTYNSEGVHGFWRGAIAPLLSITLVRTISFSIYQRAKYTYDGYIEKATGTSPLEHANTPGAWPSFGTVACFAGAGMTSGTILTAISCPFELTKLSAQIAVLMERGAGKWDSFEAPQDYRPQRHGDPSTAASTPSTSTTPQHVDDSSSKSTTRFKPSKSHGTWATARTIIAHRGPLGLYSGFHLHLMRDTMGTAIYFTTYESSKQILANARGQSPTSPGAVAVAGGLCGLVSWACIYPIDSAKSIYQRNILTSFLMAARRAEERGETYTGEFQKPKTRIQFNRRMYRGIGVSMARSCIINAVFFSVFEMIKKAINRLSIEDEDGSIRRKVLD